jgi:hypothetical protein
MNSRTFSGRSTEVYLSLFARGSTLAQSTNENSDADTDRACGDQIEAAKAKPGEKERESCHGKPDHQQKHALHEIRQLSRLRISIALFIADLFGLDYGIDRRATCRTLAGRGSAGSGAPAMHGRLANLAEMTFNVAIDAVPAHAACLAGKLGHMCSG